DKLVTGVQTCALPIYAGKKVQGVAQRGAAAVRAEQEGVADEPQHVAGALARRDVVLDAVAELEQGGPVVVGQGAERQHRRQLRRSEERRVGKECKSRG